jgi:hypothetical protein
MHLSIMMLMATRPRSALGARSQLVRAESAAAADCGRDAITEGVPVGRGRWDETSDAVNVGTGIQPLHGMGCVSHQTHPHSGHESRRADYRRRDRLAVLFEHFVDGLGPKRGVSQKAWGPLEECGSHWSMMGIRVANS